MALEPAGGSYNINKLVEKLQKIYPDYDFSKKPPLDRKCKVVEGNKPCTKKDVRDVYLDSDGNERCAFLFKQVGDTPFSVEQKGCHAIITTPEERKRYEQGDIF